MRYVYRYLPVIVDRCTSISSQTVREDGRGACAVPVTDAWVIALAYGDVLRDRVRLETQHGDGDAVLKSYPWVRLCAVGGSRALASSARCAAVAWFALSCCPGYSGREHPEFWKCVFSELWSRHTPSSVSPPWELRDDQSITDADAFFEESGVEFPRFRLEVTDLADANAEACVRLFCGVSDEQLHTDDAATLEQMLARLAPWIDPQRAATRRATVGFVGLHAFRYSQPGSQPAVASRRGYALLSLLHDVNHRPHGNRTDWSTPTFPVQQLVFTEHFSLHSPDDVDVVSQILETYELEVDVFKCPVGEDLARGIQPALVQRILGVSPRGCRASILTLCLSTTGSYAKPREYRYAGCPLPRYASALPYTRSVIAVSVGPSGTWGTELYTQDLAWVAYALFHPDTPSSTWRKLRFTWAAFTEHSGVVLAAMARGNNLVAILEGKEPTSDGYYRARLGPKTVVLDQPVSDLNRWFKTASRSSTVLTVGDDDDGVEVDVCDVCTTNTTQWSKWVAVVLPGYGLGMVRSVDVASAYRREPAPVSLTSLSVNFGGAPISHTPHAVASALCTLGSSLRHLHLGRSCVFTDAAGLEQALQHCPRLESLVITHTGALWTDASSKLLPNLRALRWILCEKDQSNQVHHAESSRFLSTLEIVQLRSQGASTPFAEYRDMMQRLLRDSTRLRVVHWQDALLECSWSHYLVPYTQTCAMTSHSVLGLGAGRATSSRGLSGSHAAAFLSVLSRGDTTMRRLDHPVIRLILELAGCRQRVVLEPAAVDMPVARRGREMHSLPI